MTPTHAISGGKRYRYYVCSAALKFGRHTCPAPSVAALALEQVVLEQIRTGQDAQALRLLGAEGWQQLPPLEQTRLVRLLIERVDYDGHAEQLAIALRPGGRERLAQEELADQGEPS
jgi:hypothetical protein